MDKKPIKKLYYSIGEVSEMTELKPYVLRYWETEFPILNPSKNRAGNRVYRDRDIQLIFHIKDLLYEQKYTIEGARQQLENYNPDEPEQSSENGSGSESAELQKNVEQLKHELKEILELLDE
ncbi:MAG: MerR family transcriptional regulator [Candidatus Marinimicrobia bacterium]|nr:MerR family transcriptional regulator [Candidatus Neomarinimicrobiota bacterium]MCF7880633.1 MerR family transcriptional regulator [Candidatus Neomarinimicrobiota bacterium]